MSDAVPQVEEQTEPPVEPAPASSRRMVRIVGMGLIIVAVVLGWLLLVGYLGYQSGQQKMVSLQQEAFTEQMSRQIALAQENIDLGNYELAQVRVAWLLERDPKNPEVQQLQAQVEQAVAQSVSVTAVATPVQAEVVSSPTPEPSPTPGQIASPEEELQRIRRQIVRKEWDDTVNALVAFQLQFPSYERSETDQLLYDAYLGYSQELLEGSQVELGLYYLDQAETLGNLPQSMIDYRTWAELYTQGISFYGVNWDAASYYFRDLCLAAPFYQDSCTKLHESLVGFGDQYAGMQEWCPAQTLYEEAWRQTSTSELSDKLDVAREGCLSATPTPSGPITGTVPITGSVPFSGTVSQPGAPFELPTPTP